MQPVAHIESRQVLNSESEYALEVDLVLQDGAQGIESCATGTTLGDHDSPTVSPSESSRLSWKLQKVLGNRTFGSQRDFDSAVVATLGEARPGRVHAANVAAAFSMAFARACARAHGIPLWEHIAAEYSVEPSIPGVIANLINGGAHGSPELPIAEAMVVGSAPNLRNTVGALVGVFTELKRLVVDEFGPLGLARGIEGGFVLNGATSERVLALLEEACASSSAEVELRIGIDMAATSLINPDTGVYEIHGPRVAADLSEMYERWFADYPRLWYLEDPFGDSDYHAWCAGELLRSGRLIVADDLTSTSSERLSSLGTTFCGVIAKISQCGTLSNLMDFCIDAKASGKSVIVSQRSRETDSSFLSHLAIGAGADFIKAGNVGRERIVKYNELLRISDSFARSEDSHDH